MAPSSSHCRRSRPIYLELPNDGVLRFPDLYILPPPVMIQQSPIVFTTKFYRSIKRRNIAATAYLAFHYIRLYVYGLVFQKNFVSSHSPVEMSTVGPNSGAGTGNFPINPSLIRKLLKKAGYDSDTSLVDVGCGSGLVLFVASRLGILNLTGVEYGEEPAMLAQENLKNIAHVIHGDAFDVDYSQFQLITFFSPFRGVLALRFFEENLCPFHRLITVNHDPLVDPLLLEMGFEKIYYVRHPLYKNFNGHVWLHKNYRYPR